MIKTLFLGAIFAMGNSFALAVDIPRHPITIANFSDNTKVGKDLARIKVSFALSESEDDNAIQLGGIVLCSDTVCYRPTALNTFNASNTAKGRATLAVDAVMPYGKVNRIYFDDISGAKVVAGAVQLTTPLVVEKGYYGGEIFITLSRKKSAKQVIYQPSGVASGLFHSEAHSVYYDPKFATNVILPLNTVLTIPAAALATPQIFSVAVSYIGKKYPQIDIFPYITLNKAASVSSMPLVRAAKSATSTAKTVPPFTPVPGSAIPAQGDAGSSSSAHKAKSFFKTGLFDLSHTANPQSSALATTCDQIIAYPPNLKIIKDKCSVTIDLN